MEGETSYQAHGTQTLSQFTDYESAGKRLDGGSPQMMNYVGSQYPSYNNYTNYGSLQQPYQTTTSAQAIEGCYFEIQPQLPSPFMVYQLGGFRDIYVSHAFGGTYDPDSRRFTCKVSGTLSTLHFPRVPRYGDIFCSRRFDDVLILDLVSTKVPRGHHSQSSSAYPRDKDLYHVHADNGVAILKRMGHEIFTFHEENTTATYYLPNEDTALHFNRVPRDGDIFCSQRNGNVVILEALPRESPQEHHNELPQDKDLYRIQERNGGFSIMKMDTKNMPSVESYFIAGTTQKEGGTYTYYLHDKHMACHFTRLPTNGDLFDSRRRNNIMILDVAPRDHLGHHHSYGSLWDTDLYRVRQKDDGFELVKVTYSEIAITAEDKIRQGLKIRRYTAPNTTLDKEEGVCALCLAAYRDFDRIASIDCGHVYHVGCIIPRLLEKGVCPTCKKRPW